MGSTSFCSTVRKKGSMDPKNHMQCFANPAVLSQCNATAFEKPWQQVRGCSRMKRNPSQWRGQSSSFRHGKSAYCLYMGQFEGSLYTTM